MTEAALNAIGEAVRKGGDSDAGAKKGRKKESGGKIEARLESLAKMYEAKKNEKTKKDSASDSDDTEDG